MLIPLFLFACGGGGGGSSSRGSHDNTGFTEVSDATGGSDSGATGDSDATANGAGSGSDNALNSGAGSSSATSSPRLAGLLTDQGLIGPGRIIDDTIQFLGSAPVGGVVHLYLNGQMAGSSLARNDGNWMLDFTSIPLAPGAYSATLMSVMPNGSTVASASPFNFVYDPTAPAAPVIIAVSIDSANPSDGITNDNTLLISGTSSSASTVEVFLGAVLIGSSSVDAQGDWSFDYSATILPDGNYVLSAESIYLTQRSATSAQYPLLIDTVAPLPPVVLSVSPDTGASATDAITQARNLIFSGTAETLSAVRVFIDGTLVGSTGAAVDGVWSLNYSATTLPDGIYQVAAMQLDRAGNISTLSAPLIVQVVNSAPTAPTGLGFAPDTGISGDGLTQAANLVFTGNATALDFVNVMLDGMQIGTVQADSNGLWQLDYSGTTLADGQYQLTAQAVDGAGNLSAVSTPLLISVDATAPAAPVFTGYSTDTGLAGDQFTADTTLILDGTAEANADVAILQNGVPIGSTSANGGGIWQFDHSAIVLSDGLYQFTAQATDSAGNISVLSAVYPITVDTMGPSQPVIAAVSTDTGTAGDGITSDNTLIISGTAEANVVVSVLIDAVSIGIATADGSGNWSFDYTGTTLADGSYAITATATDSAGNASAASAAFNITIDTGTPAVPAVTAITTDTGTAGDGITSDNTLIFGGTADANATVDVLIDAGSIGTTTANGAGVWSFDYTGTTLADNTYAITAIASDGAGNNSPASAAMMVTVDARAPAIASLTPADAATGVALTQNLVLQLDEAVQVASGNIVIRHYIDDTVFETIPIGDARVTGGGTDTLTINPTANFVGATQYYVEIAAGAVTDAVGNNFVGFSGNGTWAFTVTATAITATVPADEATNVALDTSLTFTFNEAVIANVGNVLIRKVSDNSIVDTIDMAVASVGGDGTDTLVLNQSGVLDPNSTYYVEIEAGAFINANNVAFAGISGNSTLNFTTINVSIPTVTNVTSSIANGTYSGNDTIPIQVQFSSVVDVIGTPQMYINLDGADKYINYSSGSGTNILQFDYLVATGDTSPDLDYVSSAALVLNGGSIRNSANANANLTLSNPGAAGSLGANKNIVITAAALDITNITVTDGFLIEGSEASTVYFGHSVSGGGDFNGDGYEDLAIGVPDSNLSNTSGGYAYLVFGKAGATRANLAMSAFTGADGIRVTGAAGTDRLGSVVDISGDLNGDGYDDFVIVSSQADAAVSNSGTAYVMWGSASPADINISSVNTSDGFTNANGFVIAGYESADALGYFLSSDPRNAQYLDASGDFNGDGIDDLLIGHDQSDANGADSGIAYLIFGQTGATRANLRLDTYTAGFRIYTSEGSDVELGHSVQYIGDFNGDGFNDILIGAPQSDGGATDSGQAYVIFGHAGPGYGNVDVATLNGSDGFAISTTNSNAQLGGSVASADLNGDGLTDIIIGAPEADTVSRTNNGAAIVLYGNTGSPYSDINLSSIPAGAGFLIHGENNTDRASWSVRGAGDVNGDGIDDFMLSTVHDDEGGTSAGAAWVIYGKTGTARGAIDLATLSSSDGFKIIGDRSADDFGKSATAGDINGDGYQDLMISSVAGDNGGNYAGEVNVIWGKDFSAAVFPGLTGNASANSLVGTSGADTIVGGGGADTVSAGAGDDLIQMADLSFMRVDGGRGTDTLELTGSGLSLDLRTQNYEIIQGIEYINLGDNGNGLSLNKAGLLGLSDEVRTLYVRGGSSDWVATDSGETWVANGTVVVNTITYDRYDLGAVSLFVQQSLSQPVVPAAPVVTGYSTDTGTPGDGITGDNTLVFSGTTGAYYSVEVFIGGVSVGSTSANSGGVWSFNHSATTLADATYSITARATNLGGYTSVTSAALAVTVDASAPVAPAITGFTTDTGTPADGITSDATLIISGTAEANASITVLANAVSIGTTTANGAGVWSFDYTLTALADNTYAMTAIATDTAGNDSAASAAFTITIDTGIPAAPVVSGITSDNGTAGDGITNDTTLVINGTAEANASVEVFRNTVSIGTASANGAGNWSYNDTGTILGAGSYQFTATASDSAGNTSVASAGFDVTIDTTAPLVSTLSPADDATGILLAANLVITFDSVVSVQSGNITIRRQSDNAIFEQIPVADPRITGGGTTTVTINPTATLVGGVGYYVQIDATAFDDVAGNSYAGISDTTSWSFTAQGLNLVSSTPADDATNVALNSTLVLNFNVAALSNGGNITIRHSSDNSVFETINAGSGQVTGTGTTTVTITPSDVFNRNTGYYVEIDATAFVSGTGAGYAGISGGSTLNFTTASPPIPTVTNVTSSTANGTYGQGATIVVQVQFSELVNVTLATPQLTMDLEGLDRTVSYASGSGSTTLVFNYVVKFGDISADLDYVAVNSLSANGARLRSANYVNADLTLPAPAAAGSLGANKAIVISAGSISVGTLGSADGFQVQGDAIGEHVGWTVNSVGDVNGDGFEDFVTGAPDSSVSAGAAYIVYGKAGATRSNINTSTISNGTNGFKITGQSSSDHLGGAVGGAGDINDDGYDDIYVIAPGDDDYNTDAGIVYVIYGKASNTDVAISSFSSAIGFLVTTAESGAAIGDSYTGYTGNGQSISAGGDFNGDGVQDLVLGLRLGDSPGVNSGKAYVIFGRAATTRDNVNLDLISPSGSEGVLIYGASAGWQLGQAARFVGDFDADGYDDIVVSALYSDAVVTDGGQSFLIFGSPGPVFNAVDVTSLNGGSGFKISSANTYGVLGHAVAGGDFNGDGISDLFVSQNGYNTTTGAAYVIYGDDSGSYANIDVDTMPGSAGYGIFGQAVSEYLGHSLANAGDFNGDGIDDLLLASYLRDDGGPDSGAAWLITGQDGTARGNMNIATLTTADGFKISGGGVGDHFGQSTHFGDINGDGLSDLIVGASWGDNAANDGGEAVVLWGREFNAAITAGLTGTTGVDNLIGTSGNDTIVSGGGADAISAGAGNDTIQLSDTSFYNIDGGLGTDTLQFVTSLNSLNLSTFGPEVIKGIEVIDLGSSNSLQVSQARVQSLTRQSRALFVKGDNSDTVTSTYGDAWCYTGTKVVGGITYNVYLDNGAILYIQNGIDHSGVGNFTSTQQYTFNTTSGGANVSAAVTNFPVLIRVSTTIRNTLQAGRIDLRFTDKDQLSWLPYEIEIGASGELFAWVLVPQIDGNSSSDYIVMHYNDKVNGSVADRQDPPRVWFEYGGVWHFDEASGNALDATGYQNSGTQTGTVSRVSFGIGRGAEFNSATEKFTVPYDISLNLAGGKKTWTFMLMSDFPGCTGFGWNSSIANIASGGANWSLRSANVGFFGNFQGPKATLGSASMGGSLAPTWWSSECDGHLALTYDSAASTESRFYWGGDEYDNDSTAQNFSSLALTLGNTGLSSAVRIDEARLARKVFSANYIRLTSANLSSTSVVSP